MTLLHNQSPTQKPPSSHYLEIETALFKTSGSFASMTGRQLCSVHWGLSPVDKSPSFPAVPGRSPAASPWAQPEAFAEPFVKSGHGRRQERLEILSIRSVTLLVLSVFCHLRLEPAVSPQIPCSLDVMRRPVPLKIISRRSFMQESPHRPLCRAGTRALPKITAQVISFQIRVFFLLPFCFYLRECAEPDHYN